MSAAERVKADFISASVSLIRWTLAANGVGDYVKLPNSPDRSVHVYGDLGGGTLTMQGSNEPIENPEQFGSLHDPGGTAIAINAANTLATISENTLYVRPSLAGATAPNCIIVLVSKGVVK